MATLPLNTGASIPVLGLGTYLSKKHEVERAVEVAVRAGYRHLDLALIYANQREVSAALKRVIPEVVKREELFITTKLWNTSHRPEAVEKELDRSLKQLGLDYLDLYLMHWPVAMGPKHPEIDNSVTVAETWLAMHALLRTGKVKAIGVSNFTVQHLKDLIAATGIIPAVNQVELHPYLHQNDLLAYAKEKGIHLTAYYPIGGAPVRHRESLLDNPTVKEIAAARSATTAQVLLAWGLSRGYSVIPKSITPERIISNFKRIELSAEELQRITDIGKTEQTRFAIPAVWKPAWDVNIFDTPVERERTKGVVQIVRTGPAASAAAAAKL